MILVIVGTLTLILGYKTYKERKTRISGFVRGLQYKTVLLPEKGAKTLGLLLSAWGLIFLVLGIYILLAKTSSYNILAGIWLVGVFVINIGVIFYFQKYLREELTRP